MRQSATTQGTERHGADQKVFLIRVLMLTGASTIAPLVLLMAQPLLTRLYLPAEYGVFGIFEATLAILVAIATLGFHLPIPVRESDAEAAQLLLIALLTVLGSSVLLYIFLNYYGITVVQFLRAESLAPYLWLLPLAVFFSGSYLACNAWVLRRQDFSAIARARMTQGISQAVVQVVLGVLQFSLVGLLAGLVIGRVAALTALVRNVGLVHQRPAMAPASRHSILQTAWQNRRFPILATWSGAISVVSLQISVLLVGFFYGAETVGFFSLAFMVIVGPVHIVNGAVIQTFLAEAGKLARAGNLGNASLMLFSNLSRYALAPALVLAWFAPDLFTLVFGNEWRPAGVFAQYLAPALVVSFMGAHLPAVVIVKGEQCKELVFNVLHLLLRVAGLAVGAVLDNAILSVMLYAVVSIVCLLAYDLWLLKVAGSRVQDIATAVLREILAAILVLTPVALGEPLFGTAPLASLVISLALWLGWVGYNEIHGKV